MHTFVLARATSRVSEYLTGRVIASLSPLLTVFVMPSVLEEACAASGVTPTSISEAAKRIRPHTHVTPVLTSTLIDSWLSGSSPPTTKFFFKAECFQKTGSFKFRGATNTVSVLQDCQFTRGRAVVTHSSGNHAQALSAAARVFDIPAHVVIPKDASVVKSEAARAYGGTVHVCDSGMEARTRTAERVLRETNGVLVHPFLDARVVSGQGTVGSELVQQVKALDAVVVPIGGGGLVSGVTIAIKSASPETKIIGAEASAADAAAQSLAAGKRVASYGAGTIADGVRAGVGELGWEVVNRLVEEVIVVEEEDIQEAMRVVMERMKIVIEPSAAVGVAACRTLQFREKGFQRVGVVLCGGNVDLHALPWSGMDKAASR